MNRNFASLVCATALLAAPAFALAGAYGDKGSPEESPAPVAMAPVTAPAPAPEAAYGYLRGGFVYSFENFDRSADNAQGFHLRAGRRLCDMFAVEGEFADMVSNFDNIHDSTGKTSADVKSWNITVNGKFFPIKGRFEPFALVGMGYGRDDIGRENKGSFVARFGIGLDVAITDNVGVGVESDYLLGTGDVKNFDQIPLSVDVFYNFL